MSSSRIYRERASATRRAGVERRAAPGSAGNDAPLQAGVAAASRRATGDRVTCEVARDRVRRAPRIFAPPPAGRVALAVVARPRREPDATPDARADTDPNSRGTHARTHEHKRAMASPSIPQSYIGRRRMRARDHRRLGQGSRP